MQRATIKSDGAKMIPEPTNQLFFARRPPFRFSIFSHFASLHQSHQRISEQPVCCHFRVTDINSAGIRHITFIFLIFQSPGTVFSFCLLLILCMRWNAVADPNCNERKLPTAARVDTCRLQWRDVMLDSFSVQKIDEQGSVAEYWDGWRVQMHLDVSGWKYCVVADFTEATTSPAVPLIGKEGPFGMFPVEPFPEVWRKEVWRMNRRRPKGPWGVERKADAEPLLSLLSFSPAALLTQEARGRERAHACVHVPEPGWCEAAREKVEGNGELGSNFRSCRNFSFTLVKSDSTHMLLDYWTWCATIFSSYYFFYFRRSKKTETLVSPHLHLSNNNENNISVITILVQCSMDDS